MKDSQNKKLMAIDTGTLVVGVDIAKSVQWARFVDYRGIELSKALRFNNTIDGFKSIVEKCENLKKSCNLKKVIIGMEPTGNYWKPLANFLIANQIEVVTVGTYQTKMAKSLDDNSPTKSDVKDALTIARLIKDGRYSEVYMPDDIYADLRILGSLREQTNNKLYAVKNRIHNVIVEYFPEFTSVFKNPFNGKASMQILKNCPFPSQINALGVDGVILEIKKSVKKTVGRKKAEQIVKAAKTSVGVTYGMKAAQMKLSMRIAELELLQEQLSDIEKAMEEALIQTGFSETLLAIKGIGIVSAANILGEVGDFKRFKNERQIHRLAGYNLTENSSGNNKSSTRISKRGRKRLRSVLFQSAIVMVTRNDEMKSLYAHLKNRNNNPLKSKQALVVVAKKIITIIYKLITKGTRYEAKLVFNNFRSNQIEATLKAA